MSDYSYPYTTHVYLGWERYKLHRVGKNLSSLPLNKGIKPTVLKLITCSKCLLEPKNGTTKSKVMAAILKNGVWEGNSKIKTSNV